MKIARKLRPRINSVTTGRWTAYAVAAAATGFAATPSAEASIHYSGPLHTRVKGASFANFPLGGAILQITHFNDVYGSSSNILGGTAVATMRSAAGGILGSVNGFIPSCAEPLFGSASNLNRGNSIAARPFIFGRGFLAQKGLLSSDCGVDRGQFVDRQRGAFIGFKFNNGAGVQYGWARLKMNGPPDYNCELVDYAYGDPGDSIVAGQTSDGTAPALESLGALAVGATALLGWRQRRRGT